MPVIRCPKQTPLRRSQGRHNPQNVALCPGTAPTPAWSFAVTPSTALLARESLCLVLPWTASLLTVLNGKEVKPCWDPYMSFTLTWYLHRAHAWRSLQSLLPVLAFCSKAPGPSQPHSFELGSAGTPLWSTLRLHLVASLRVAQKGCTQLSQMLASTRTLRGQCIYTQSLEGKHNHPSSLCQKALSTRLQGDLLPASRAGSTPQASQERPWVNRARTVGWRQMEQPSAWLKLQKNNTPTPFCHFKEKSPNMPNWEWDTDGLIGLMSNQKWIKMLLDIFAHQIRPKSVPRFGSTVDVQMPQCSEFKPPSWMISRIFQPNL